VTPAIPTGEFQKARKGVYELKVEKTFAAAHHLREYEGQCERLHGHNWRVEVVLGADELDHQGMVMDFRCVKEALDGVVDGLDHHYLNEIEPFDTLNPTTENLCRFIAEELGGVLPDHVSVRRVSCWESEKCAASYIPGPE
jgi:6-pyruvoyltetrahydropterin/6-carboxytetrahydropterin synthase